MVRALAWLGLGLSLGAVRLPAQSAQAANQESLQQADAAFRAGYAAQQAGQLDVAREQFAEAVKLAPGIAEAHEALGTVLVEMGKPADAVPQLEAAARLKPDDQGIETNLALAYAQSGEAAKSRPGCPRTRGA